MEPRSGKEWLIKGCVFWLGVTLVLTGWNIKSLFLSFGGVVIATYSMEFL